jgi:hypothetical protein
MTIEPQMSPTESCEGHCTPLSLEARLLSFALVESSTLSHRVRAGQATAPGFRVAGTARARRFGTPGSEVRSDGAGRRPPVVEAALAQSLWGGCLRYR